MFLQANELMRQHIRIDMDVLQKACDVLKVFKDVTTHMSSQQNTTASLLKPLLHQLLVHSKPREDDPPSIHQAKAALYHDLENR